MQISDTDLLPSLILPCLATVHCLGTKCCDSCLLKHQFHNSDGWVNYILASVKPGKGKYCRINFQLQRNAFTACTFLTVCVCFDSNSFISIYNINENMEAQKCCYLPSVRASIQVMRSFACKISSSPKAPGLSASSEGPAGTTCRATMGGIAGAQQHTQAIFPAGPVLLQKPNGIFSGLLT